MERDDRPALLFAIAWGSLLGMIPLAVWYSIDHFISRLGG